eukprot:Nitzschia sp. Nitz4//scaffold44_size153857//71490//72413//NITZ4_002723-RA/size153857-processed-gene-0.66-mRNA-1//1//CDS//3329552163//72//frame0
MAAATLSPMGAMPGFENHFQYNQFDPYDGFQPYNNSIGCGAERRRGSLQFNPQVYHDPPMMEYRQPQSDMMNPRERRGSLQFTPQSTLPPRPRRGSVQFAPQHEPVVHAASRRGSLQFHPRVPSPTSELDREEPPQEDLSNKEEKNFAESLPDSIPSGRMVRRGSMPIHFGSTAPKPQEKRTERRGSMPLQGNGGLHVTKKIAKKPVAPRDQHPKNSDAVHPRRLEWKKSRKENTVAGVWSGALVGGIVMAPVLPLGMLIGAAVGGYTCNKVTKKCERSVQRSFEQQNFQKGVKASPLGRASDAVFV